jgi:hypothetical protein
MTVRCARDGECAKFFRTIDAARTSAGRKDFAMRPLRSTRRAQDTGL